MIRLWTLPTLARLAATVALASLASMSMAQIGGKTAADGPFVIDDIEDLNLSSETLGRDWIPDFIGEDPALQAIDPSTAGLTLASGQSSSGVFEFTAPAPFGFIDTSFGIPMPSVAGASTLDNPGDITSFTYITFQSVADIAIPGIEYNIILECYPQNPDDSFPRVFWNFQPATGTTFDFNAIELRQPSSIANNQNSRTLEELLGQTRFLSFYVYAETEQGNVVNLYMDDITLQEQPSSAEDWLLY